jgi:hypothetical protein
MDKDTKKDFHSQVLSNLSTYQITHNSEISDETPVVYINEKKFAVKGDISFITGQPKAGKTSIATYILATAFLKDVPKELDTLQIRSTHHAGKKVIYIDTEQPLSQTNRLRKKVCKVINATEEPQELLIFNIRAISRKEKKNEVFAIIDHFKDDLHFVVIDGIADLVKDPNLADESFDLIDDLMRRALAYNISILAYIHQNPASDKSRGHMGSEAERKCGGMVSIKKDKDQIHSIESRYMRYDANLDTVFFVYDTEKQDFRTLDSNETQKVKERKELDKQLELYEWVHGLFEGGHRQLSHTDLKNGLMQAEGVAERTAKNRIEKMKQYNFIKKEENGSYSFVEHKELTRKILFVEGSTENN